MKVFLFVGGTVGLTLALMYLTAATAALLQRGPLPFNPLLHPAEMAFRLLILGVCLLLVWASGFPLTRFGVVPFSFRRDVAAAVAGGLLLAWTVNFVSRLVVPDAPSGFYSKNALQSVRPRTVAELVAVCLVALPAALLEELLFRGMWVGGFSAWVPPVWLIAVSGLLFGLMHLAQGLWGVLVTAFVGIVLGVAFVWTGSLWFVLGVHWTVNVNQFVVACFWPAFFGLTEEESHG